MLLTVAQALTASHLDVIDARALLRHALGVDDAYLIANSSLVLTEDQSALFGALAARRTVGEPVAYITGLREFFSLEFKVTPAVLIPRPETELLAEVALEHIVVGGTSEVLDLGTGSGCIAITVASLRPGARVTAVDTSMDALAVARENAHLQAVKNLEVMQSDWFSALAGRRYNLIVSNPPYVAVGDPHLTRGDLRYEPPSALAADVDGLDCIRLIVAAAPQYLVRGGWLAFEHGWDQAARCRDLLAQAGFARVFSRADLSGIARVSGGIWDRQ